MAENRWWLPGLAMAALLAVALLFGAVFGKSGGSAEAFTLAGLDASTAHHYEFAAAHPDGMARIPCYCGCVGLDHGSLLDCFVKPGGGYEEHASGCKVCRDEAVDLQRFIDSGRDVSSARAYIDAQYSKLGRPTDTP